MADQPAHDAEHPHADQAALLDLMETRVEPAIRRVVRSKLHATLLDKDEHSENQDALELLSEIRVATLNELSGSENGNKPNIDSVVSYATRIGFRRKTGGPCRKSDALFDRFAISAQCRSGRGSKAP
jgi:hypothetical protein